MNILLIGNGAREHAIAEAMKKNKYSRLFSYMKSKNPGIEKLSDEIELGDYSDLKKINKFAKDKKIDFAFIGPEGPLNNGVVDSLEEINVPSIGPKQKTAILETSKAFARELLDKYGIEGNIKFKVFTNKNIEGIDEFLEELDEVVIKPDGLTGGKGVKVQGDDFKTNKEAISYCKEVLETHDKVVVEEKLDGEEFSLQCLTDGKTVVGTPVAQDHKRAYEDDKGPNTGGMGSYTYSNHLLPFLKKEHVNKALEITKKVADAIYEETGTYYVGVMYGGFILTKDGVKLVEFNARFGDPEAMNIFPILKTDFVSICESIIVQELSRIKVEFEKKATVCKYAVPEGYPENPVKNEKVELTKSSEAKIYYASVDQKEDGLYMTGSRALAFVGIAKDIEEAEKIAEEAVSEVKGKVFHRKDIGTKLLIDKRIEHINRITD